MATAAPTEQARSAATRTNVLGEPLADRTADTCSGTAVDHTGT